MVSKSVIAFRYTNITPLVSLVQVFNNIIVILFKINPAPTQ